MSLLTIVQSLELPISMVIGVAGFAFCMIADHIKNKDLKAAAQEDLDFDEDGNVIQKPLPHKQQIFCWNIAGFICMFASLFALWFCGYFDQYITMMFGN